MRDPDVKFTEYTSQYREQKEGWYCPEFGTFTDLKYCAWSDCPLPKSKHLRAIEKIEVLTVDTEGQ